MFSRVVSNFRKKRKKSMQIKLNSGSVSSPESNQIGREEEITAPNESLSSKFDCKNGYDNKPGCEKSVLESH